MTPLFKAIIGLEQVALVGNEQTPNKNVTTTTEIILFFMTKCFCYFDEAKIFYFKAVMPKENNV
jgi:hypothetical protein